VSLIALFGRHIICMYLVIAMWGLSVSIASGVEADEGGGVTLLKAEIDDTDGHYYLSGTLVHTESEPITLVEVSIECPSRSSSESSSFRSYIGCDERLLKCDPIEAEEIFAFRTIVVSHSEASYSEREDNDCSYSISNWLYYSDYRR
tara:strand:- start:309 stop:749 length:441 start_codon:yes stop_codon:yes gene_type:complete